MNDVREQRTEEQLAVRQVTNVQVSWTEQERGESGAFTIQLILDAGAGEYVLRTTAADAELLTSLLATHRAVFDMTRKVLVFEIDPLGRMTRHRRPRTGA